MRIRRAASFGSFSGLNDHPDQEVQFSGSARSSGRFVAPGLESDRPSPGIAGNPTVPFQE
jgi:hypothetical protein